MYMTSNPREAWCIALDSGVRTQSTIDMSDAEDNRNQLHTKSRPHYFINAEGQHVRYNRDPITPSETRSRKGGAGASHGDIYWRVFACIRRMEDQQPLLAAVGHTLNHPLLEVSNRYVDDVVEALMRDFVNAQPNWNDKRVWNARKKERIEWLMYVALEERRRNISGEQPAWSPERIKDHVEHWLGGTINTRDWARDWQPSWSMIQSLIDNLEDQSISPIEEIIHREKRLLKAA